MVPDSMECVPQVRLDQISIPDVRTIIYPVSEEQQWRHSQGKDEQREPIQLSQYSD